MLAGCATLPRESAPDAPPPPAPAQIEGSTIAAPDLAARMVISAESMLGQPYLYGGAAPGGFDCSGLVQYAAGSAGIHVPRTTNEQIAFGLPIERGEVRAGDLVFMHLARKGLHVGIALDRERFIHAPATGGRVRIDSLDSAPYRAGYLRARRIIAGN